MNLPKSFISIAGKYGIEKEKIIFAATADYDTEYRFADTIVALTGEKLLLAAYPYRENAEYQFGGYGSWQTADGKNIGGCGNIRRCKKIRGSVREEGVLK